MATAARSSIAAPLSALLMESSTDLMALAKTAGSKVDPLSIPCRSPFAVGRLRRVDHSPAIVQQHEKHRGAQGEDAGPDEHRGHDCARPGVTHATDCQGPLGYAGPNPGEAKVTGTFLGTRGRHGIRSGVN